MLVLSRRVGEEIIINNNIRVTIVAAKGDRIRIGVQAPRDVSVDRAEVHVRRMQFVELPLGAIEDAHSSDADVPIGVLPAVRLEDDTLVH